MSDVSGMRHNPIVITPSQLADAARKAVDDTKDKDKSTKAGKTESQQPVSDARKVDPKQRTAMGSAGNGVAAGSAQKGLFPLYMANLRNPAVLANVVDQTTLVQEHLQQLKQDLATPAKQANDVDPRFVDAHEEMNTDGQKATRAQVSQGTNQVANQAEKERVRRQVSTGEDTSPTALAGAEQEKDDFLRGADRRGGQWLPDKGAQGSYARSQDKQPARASEVPAKPMPKAEEETGLNARDASSRKPSSAPQQPQGSSAVTPDSSTEALNKAKQANVVQAAGAQAVQKEEADKLKRIESSRRVASLQKPSLIGQATLASAVGQLGADSGSDGLKIGGVEVKTQSPEKGSDLAFELVENSLSNAGGKSQSGAREANDAGSAKVTFANALTSNFMASSATSVGSVGGVSAGERGGGLIAAVILIIMFCSKLQLTTTQIQNATIKMQASEYDKQISADKSAMSKTWAFAIAGAVVSGCLLTFSAVSMGAGLFKKAPELKAFDPESVTAPEAPALEAPGASGTPGARSPGSGVEVSVDTSSSSGDGEMTLDVIVRSGSPDSGLGEGGATGSSSDGMGPGDDYDTQLRKKDAQHMHETNRSLDMRGHEAKVNMAMTSIPGVSNQVSSIVGQVTQTFMGSAQTDVRVATAENQKAQAEQTVIMQNVSKVADSAQQTGQKAISMLDAVSQSNAAAASAAART